MTGADLSAHFKKHPLGAIGLLVCVLCGVAIYFRSSAIEEAQSRFEEKDTESQKITTNVRNMSGLEEQTNQLQAAAKDLESRIIRESQLANNRQIFYRLENETGVKLVDVRQNPVPPMRAGATRATYFGVPFAVNVQGTYPQVMAFLRRLESGQQLCRFGNITVSKASGGTTADTISANISLDLLGTQ